MRLGTTGGTGTATYTKGSVQELLIQSSGMGSIWHPVRLPDRHAAKQHKFL